VSRPGIIHAGDLQYRFATDRVEAVDAVRAVGLDVAAAPYRRAFAPPRVVVVIVPAARPELLARARAWLADAARVIVVRDGTNEPLPDGIVAAAWRDAVAAVDAEVLELRAALARAVELARDLPDDPPPMVVAAEVELPASAWVPYTRGNYLWPEYIAAKLATAGDRSVLVDATGHAIDLWAPRGPIALDYDRDAVVALPPNVADADARANHRSCGADPMHPVLFRGHRMRVMWWYAGATGACHLCGTDHDWPCGPAKKLWGYADNAPVAVAVAPHADACVQTFEHDVLVTAAVPIGWHGAGAVDVAAFAPDRRRALFYAHTAEFAADRATDDLFDEDNRELAPVVVLGPDDRVRYAVDLHHRVVRITNPDGTPAAAIVGGPGDGYVVCDADHRVVRRGTGQLLGGWFRHATVEDDGVLWREDLATGARTRLDTAARVACVDPDVELVVQDAIREGRHDAAAQIRAAHAATAITGERVVLAIPGTRNVLELADGYLRVL
jgi:hypothetical protein